VASRSGPAGGLLRPAFEAGEVLSACDLESSQRYWWQRLRRHRRYLHGAGVRCGLRVVASDDRDEPWTVRVCPGYGVSGCGDEILLPHAVPVRLSDLVWTRLADPNSGNTAWLAISFAEEPAAMAAVDESRCGCEDPVYRPSRIADAWQFRLLWSLPPAPGPGFDLCSGGTPPCPVCPETCDLVLSSIVLPQSQDEPITDAMIHNVAYAV
jgi:hypothetical protein